MSGAALFEVGAARVDITPKVLGDLYLAGFGLGRRPKGVMDPIEAGALFLRSGKTCLALVSIDLLGVMGPWVERVRVRAGLQAGQLICCATHTHSAPDSVGLWGKGFLGIPRTRGVNDAYMEQLVDLVADAISEARAEAAPARLRAATFEVPAEWTRNDRKGGAREDVAAALAFERAGGEDDGDRIATLLNFASHPEALWQDNPYISPDFPGFFRQRHRALSAGIPLYFSGALGGMLTPNVPRRADLEARKDYIQRLGTELAERTEVAVEGAAPVAVPELRHTFAPLVLSNDNWRFRWAFKRGLIHARVDGQRVATEVHHLRLGPAEILTAPGEPLPEVGQRSKALMDAPVRLLLALCTDEIGYVLEPRHFSQREYKYERTMSLGRGTSEALVAAHRALIGAGGNNPAAE